MIVSYDESPNNISQEEQMNMFVSFCDDKSWKW